ncbi:type IIL restriction-modification enzyme MmeI [Sanguibacter keddieii]|uniref:type IIL restriction-modification enzyme MmeI n=1 Tax=Sanguibacter keddieii TaxID=60920 RepID=UPI00117C5D60|nr:type IIL restriction-modification enzyme MmeI [Sanguibacter keddieii]
MGFVLEPEEAAEWIATDPRNAEVLFPYLNGEDLNSRPDASASRWVIDFNDRTEAEAASYPLPFARLLKTVKPERAEKPLAVSSAPWWRFLRTRGEMRRAIEGKSEVLVIALVSKTVMPVRVAAHQIPSHKLGVFADDSVGTQAILSSSLHWLWTVRYSSTMRADINYSPSDAFLTFPRPNSTPDLQAAGQQLESDRREIMLRRNLGLTKLYNLVNDPDVRTDRDIQHLRDIHVSIDNACLRAYGWDDISPTHGFHTYRQLIRWSTSPSAGAEILDRLLSENLRRGSRSD